MAKKCNKYLIMATENHGRRRVIHSYKTKSEANKQLRKILSPSKTRRHPTTGKKIYLTSYRKAQSGGGINNPRIKKIRGVC